MHKTAIGALFGLALSATAWAQNSMPIIELTAGFHRIEAEVAANDPNRQLGLMNRQSMPAQRGMLFVFPQNNTHCMWMRNTLLPLSVAFIDDEGKVINIEDMQPQTEDNHCARRPARYALEMNLGWFAQRGLKAGVKLNGLDKAPRPQ
ncbi:MAG: hypothetical protein CVU16_01905 [Betaproteobacteria bacterium HGW-Betaproteobacteria-10]|jgi:hypothetical protein|nr:MAG: hypothetical protein CVU16_01905 [Betaproteobacteria bacterium HGW-Betaproteobacteria-10]